MVLANPSVAPLGAATQGVRRVPYKNPADKAAHNAAYNAANKEKRAAWRAANQGRVRTYFAARSKDKIATQNRAFRDANPEYFKELYRSERYRALSRERGAKRRTDPKERLRSRISTAIRNCVRDKRGSRCLELVGYSVTDLRRHLERQFVRGMGWHNMSKWHIDHIVPLASFRFGSVHDLEFKAAWALTNLRPCWAAENIRKHAKREFLV